MMGNRCAEICDVVHFAGGHDVVIHRAHLRTCLLVLNESQCRHCSTPDKKSRLAFYREPGGDARVESAISVLVLPPEDCRGYWSLYVFGSPDGAGIRFVR